MVCLAFGGHAAPLESSCFWHFFGPENKCFLGTFTCLGNISGAQGGATVKKKRWRVKSSKNDVFWGEGEKKVPKVAKRNSEIPGHLTATLTI